MTDMNKPYHTQKGLVSWPPPLWFQQMFLSKFIWSI